MASQIERGQGEIAHNCGKSYKYFGAPPKGFPPADGFPGSNVVRNRRYWIRTIVLDIYGKTMMIKIAKQMAVTVFRLLTPGCDNDAICHRRHRKLRHSCCNSPNMPLVVGVDVEDFFTSRATANALVVSWFRSSSCWSRDL